MGDLKIDRSTARHSGAAFASTRKGSSSGRDARAACTTEFSTPYATASGESPDSRLDCGLRIADCGLRIADCGLIKLPISISSPQLNRLINPQSAIRNPQSSWQHPFDLAHDASDLFLVGERDHKEFVSLADADHAVGEKPDSVEQRIGAENQTD